MFQLLYIFSVYVFNESMKRQIDTLKLSRLIPSIREVFNKIPDNRQSDSAALCYPVSDVLMSGLAMMTVQDPSMLEFQRRLENSFGSNNLRSLFKVDKIPAASQFRRILDHLDPNLVQEAFVTCLRKLQKTRLWSEYRVLNGRYAVLIDGSEYFRSNKRGCRNCREYHHRDGSVSYAHQILAATLAHPTAKKPVPLLLEEVAVEDGVRKTDCEYNAACRLIPRITKQHPQMDIVYVADGLYSKAPFIKLIKANNAGFIIVANPADHTEMETNIAGLRKCGGVKSLEINLGQGTKGLYEWAENVELNGSTDVKINWISYTEASAKGKVKYKNTWVTNLKPTKSNIEELVCVGRHRWQIENQVFDILKNHGYRLEHNYGHGKKKLSFIFIILNFLAYMLHQLASLSDSLFQMAMEMTDKNYGLWADVKVILQYFVWDSWDSLWKHIIKSVEPSAFEYD